MLDNLKPKKKTFRPKINKSRLNLFFKLLYIIPKIKIKTLSKLTSAISRLPSVPRRYIFNKIYKLFYKIYANFLHKFCKKVYRNKGNIKLNSITYKVKGTFLYLQLNKKTKKGLTFLKFDDFSPKQQFQNYDIITLDNHNLQDFNLYKSFFLKNNKVKLFLSQSIKSKDKNNSSYNFAYKSIIVWPFTIIIKPFVIIIKNIFFNSFFVFKKRYEITNVEKKFAKIVKFPQKYELHILQVRQKKLIKNIVKTTSNYFWYTLQKYYYIINTNVTTSFTPYKNLYFYSNNIFNRGLQVYNKYFVDDENKNLKINKNNKYKFFNFSNFYKHYSKLSFIGLSFFLRLYGLYFFWFLFFINKFFYFINKLLFNFWFRFFYFMMISINIIDNNIFVSFKLLYKNVQNVYHNSNNIIFEFENIINNYINNIVCIFYSNFNYLLNSQLRNNFYKNYFLIMLFFFYKNYFFLNVFFNYSVFFNKNLNTSLKTNNNFFDLMHFENYKCNTIYNLDYFLISQKLYKRYSDNYKNNEEIDSSDDDGKKNFMEILNKKDNSILLK